MQLSTRPLECSETPIRAFDELQINAHKTSVWFEPKSPASRTLHQFDREANLFRFFFTLEKCAGAGLPATCEDIHETLYPIAPTRGGGSAGKPRGARAAFRLRVDDARAL